MTQTTTRPLTANQEACLLELLDGRSPSKPRIYTSLVVRGLTVWTLNLENPALTDDGRKVAESLAASL